MAELWAAVDVLTKPRMVKLLRDDGTADWTNVPSLWCLLMEAMGTGMEGGGASTASKYRTPVSLDVLELATSIREIVLDALTGHDTKPRAQVPDSVRALASVVTATGDEDLIGWWVYRVRSWCRQIDRVLGLSAEPRERRIRDTRCPTCQATHVTIETNGERRREPALLIDFADGLVRSASCEACGSTWFRGAALLELADTTRPLDVRSEHDRAY